MRPARRLPAVAAVAVLALIASLAVATTYRAMTMDEMVAAAEIAFFGEVRDVVAYEQGGRPWTRVVFDVERDLLAIDATGDTAEQSPATGDDGTVELSFLGGSVSGGPALAVALMPTFAVGERALVLAYDTETASPIVGFRQGLWRADGDSLRDEEGRFLALVDGVIGTGEPAASIESVLDTLATRFEELP